MKNYTLLFVTLSILALSCDDQENAQQSNPIMDFEDVTTVVVDTLDIDLVGDVNQNALYIAYSPYNDVNDNIKKYDLDTQSEIIESHPDPSDSRQLAIVGDFLYAFSTINALKMDLDLNNLQTVNSGYNIFVYSRAIVSGNSILFPFGIDNLISYNTENLTFDGDFTNLNDPVTVRSDGAVMNNFLYTFGGSTYGWNVPSDKLTKLDLGTSVYSQSDLPFLIFESFCIPYQNNIIVSGNKNSVNGGAFLGMYSPGTETYTEISTSLNLDAISIRGITVINDELFVAFTDLPISTPNAQTIKIVKSTIL